MLRRLRDTSDKKVCSISNLCLADVVAPFVEHAFETPQFHFRFGPRGASASSFKVLFHAVVFLPYHICLSLSSLQLPYQAGWQDLKDLLRSAGEFLGA